MDGISLYNNFLSLHQPQLISSGVPKHLWHTLCKKLYNKIFDSGFCFQLVQIDYNGFKKKPYDPLWSVLALHNVSVSDPNHIYLIDHAWTFKINDVSQNLRNIPGLLERMCKLAGISNGDQECQIQMVSREIWRYANCYAMASQSAEESIPIWYILDEFGSGIVHSENPNCRIVPFLHVPEQVTYSLLFFIKNIGEGEVVSRNFEERIFPNHLQREAMLIPWKHYDYFDTDFEQEEPEKSYFFTGRVEETLPNLNALDNKKISKHKLKVFTEYSLIKEHLTIDNFTLVEDEEDADILWYTEHFKAFKELSENYPYKFVNQFPYEYIITVKDLLAVIARRCQKKKGVPNNPYWLPITFNMTTELHKLAAYYMHRKRCGLDNHWICKPYNLARSLDTYITDSLEFMCCISKGTPKIAQKYIEKPVLFDRPDIEGVKFDIRYIIILKSVNPLEVYVYKNFFIRFANKSFELKNFDDYEQHFTVMNYSEGYLYRLLCEEFRLEWKKQYPDYEWSNIEKSIFEMIYELFQSATVQETSCSIKESPQSRALYAADIMLSWEDKSIQPNLLEINWMPDCKRACEYYPDFYNDVFSLMFLDKENSIFSKLSYC